MQRTAPFWLALGSGICVIWFVGCGDDAGNVVSSDIGDTGSDTGDVRHVDGYGYDEDSSARSDSSEEDCAPPTENESACDGRDDDCDGRIDEGCTCEPGIDESCYDAAPSTRGVADCTAGKRTCQSDATWGPCRGAVLPADEETCNGEDDDCDGVTDEGCPCDFEGKELGVCADQTRTEEGSCEEPDDWEQPTDEESSCDGRDNDCDGVDDEGCPCFVHGKETGACALSRQPDGTCPEPDNYRSYDVPDDGIDNDCDGETDEADWKEVHTTSNQACAVTASGDVRCWGASASPSQIPNGNYSEVSVGTEPACARELSGKVRCWGGGYRLVENAPVTEFEAIEIAGVRACGVKMSGQLACWDGQSYPDIDVRDVGLGAHTSCAVTTGGAVDCWEFRDEDAKPSTGGNFERVAAGRSHACALRSNGEIACWGSNLEGETDPPPGQFEQISAGYFGNCALDASGNPTCWGANVHGQADPPDVRFRQITIHDGVACGVTRTGDLKCWGSDDSQIMETPSL